MFVNTQQGVRRRASSGLDIRFGMQRTTRTLRGLVVLCIAPCVMCCVSSLMRMRQVDCGKSGLLGGPLGGKRGATNYALNNEDCRVVK